MVLILHGHPMSTCTRRVLVTAIEAGLYNEKDFKMESVADFGAIKAPEWIAHQPFGQMPWLEDTETGIEIFESRAIVNYVARKAGKLLPPSSDVTKLAAFDQAVSVETSNFDPSASGIAAEIVFIPMHGGKTDDARVEKLTTTLAAKLKGYEAILSKQKYVAGNELTVADLYHLPYGKMASELGKAPALTDGSLPNVARWWKEISSLPSWAQANALGGVE